MSDKACEGVNDLEMSDEDFQNVLTFLSPLAMIVRPMKLAAFIRRCEAADTTGPFLDPTGWNAGHKHLDAMRKMAEGLQRFQAALPTLEEATAMDARRDAVMRAAGRG
jgi:hypothetical protein